MLAMQQNRNELRLNPFAECGRTTSNIGYRDVLTGQVVASVEIPIELIERTVLAEVSVEIALSSKGHIAAAASGGASVCSSAMKTVSIDNLVEAFLDSDNLQKEEATERELSELLQRLQKSVQAVQHALALLRQTTD
jgi:hypothetical protein